MATMSSTSQNTTCIRDEKRNISLKITVNPSGNGSGMFRHQKKAQKTCSDNNILPQKRSFEIKSHLLSNKMIF